MGLSVGLPELLLVCGEVGYLNDNSRWSRQINIPQFGQSSQEKLQNARVVVFGAGGVGSPAALYLAAAGVGSLVLVDRDCVELSNLNRQIMFTTKDIGKHKAQVAEAYLLELDPGLNIEKLVVDAGNVEIETLISGADAVIDSFDSNVGRLLINDVCLKYGVMSVHAFVENFSGNVIISLPFKKGCLRCLVDEHYPEQFCTPVIGIAAGQAGIISAARVISYLTGIGVPNINSRIFFDMAFSEWTIFPLENNPYCPVCGKRWGEFE